MHIIGLVCMYGGTMRPILNAETVPFTFATGFFNRPLDAGLAMQVYPNPLQTRSTISFNLQESGHVKLEVYNLIGQKMRVLVDDVTNSGMHSVIWDGQDEAGHAVANGHYILRLNTEGGVQAAQRVLVNR